MRAIHLLLAFGISLGSTGSAANQFHHSALAKLKQEFRFDAGLQPRPAENPDNEILVLDKFIVRQPPDWRSFEEGIRKNAQRLDAERFTFKEGGPFASKDFGAVRAQIGIWPGGSGYVFVRFRAYPNNNISISFSAEVAT